MISGWRLQRFNGWLGGEGGRRLCLWSYLLIMLIVGINLDDP